MGAKSAGREAISDLSEGLALHRSGQFDQAAARYARVRKSHPSYADAQHLLGLLAFQRGDLVAAETSIRAAIKLKAGVADFHYNLGSVLAAGGKQAAAINAFRYSLRLRPRDAAAWNNLGNALLAEGVPGEAEQAFREALKYDPASPLMHCNLGNALAALGRRDEAVAAYGAALARQPIYPDAAVNLGAQLVAGGDAAAALPALENAWRADPRSTAVQNTLAVVLRQMGREAEAEPLLRQALAQAPELAEVWNNLATVLKDLGQLDEAEACALQATRLRADYGLAFLTLGTILLQRARYEEAQAADQRAVDLLPDDAAARWNLGLVHLVRGDLAQGFSLFDERLRLPQARHLYPDMGAPLWRGEDLAGRRILLYAEQGLGDTLQFIRYAPLLAERGARVVVRCPGPLVALLATVSGVERVLGVNEAPEALDYVCPMMSLPLRLGTTLDNIPASTPYLRVPPTTLAAWAERLGPPDGRMRVGLVWAGDPRPNDYEANRIDRRRSLPLAAMAPLLELDGIEFHSLQKGAGAAQLESSPFASRLVDWSGQLTDFVETAGLMQQLDLLISADTAVVHLAGALARPVWVLSRFDGCWRWLTDRDDSPWYPTLRLFRQSAPGSWQAALAAVRAALIDSRDRLRR